ncbi:expressed hypothetical protein [Trichoplax adhaerens]|uniref:Translocon-associated protein subunit gamma n=1 Tax=Trichoplax adhaerens TaxID=10228 RepID=B3S0B2_TRIAD|nr:expressed hypothetical protein [Trichoplax adhaerens]EDV23981.1 expressed hypothetical protein [Trichoplax adhaerens]|eukprot:XP_002113507.1 expressed hypothetical protein [Trichoplax adhaerens]
MPASKSRKSEDDLLLQDFSKNVTTASSVIFYINALLVSVVPIWVFWRIHQLDPRSAVIIYVLGAAVSTYMVAFAYKNVKFNLKHKIAVSRDEGVTREVSNQLNNSANGKKINKKERDESNYILSTAVAAGLVALFSTGS